ncbi:MAG: Ppx/GppA family phosphatase [Candidatus Eisenbacteria bacterium]|nr:Ppx/GppA family phosphatase [Candidatus Eisenbacteria bacterium]
MGRIAAIDLGTNSMKLLVADAGDGEIETVIDRFRVTRLGEGMGERPLLRDGAVERNLESLRLFADEAREAGARRIVAAGTEALRAARNAPDFLARAERECGVAVEILTGEEEARLSWIAALSAFDPIEGPVLLFDTGGGSTEFVFGRGGAIASRASLPLGSRVLAEAFLRSDPPGPEERTRLDHRLAFALDELEGEAARVIGVGGTVTTLAAVFLGVEPYDPARVGGASLPLAEVERQITLYASLPGERRREIPGLHPDRADVILAGAALVRAVLRRFGAPSLLVSDRGLRHGLLIDRFLRD